MANTPKPNTISDKDWASIQRRAREVAPPVMSDEATRRRLTSEAQRRAAGQS